MTAQPHRSELRATFHHEVERLERDLQAMGVLARGALERAFGTFAPLSARPMPLRPSGADHLSSQADKWERSAPSCRGREPP